TIASKRWVYRQYDHQVQNNTVILPGGADAAVVRVRPVNQISTNAQPGVAATVDCNSRYVYLDPYEGAKMVVAEAARNLSCVGAEPIAVTDNLNFGSPEKPVGYWQLNLACQGIAEACQEMATPVTGGNVSLYNETLDATGNPQPIYPTPVIGMVGLIPDLTKICGLGWQNQGDLIYLLGLPLTASVPHLSLGGSEYLAAIHGLVAGKPPVVDFDLERAVQMVTRHGIRQGWLRSAHDCAEGGLAVALAECCIANQFGAKARLELPQFDSGQRWDEILFGESGMRILVSVAPEHQASWEAELNQQLAGSWQNIGVVTQDANLQVMADDLSIIEVATAAMCDRFYGAIERRLTI
ncbi:MAG: AIR synthase related protein, partial [Coleofasciculaceae cyanobacterium]